MLSRKNLRKLVRSIYGKSNRYTRRIKSYYRNAQRQIKGEISAFIDSGQSWEGKPTKAAYEDAMAQLEQVNNQATQPLVQFYRSSLVRGHPKNKDVVQVRIASPMLRVAQQLHHVVYLQNQQTPREVAQMSRHQAAVTPELHQVPFNYGPIMQQQISERIHQHYQVDDQINRHVMDAVSRITDVAKQAAESNENTEIDWGEQVDRILTGKDDSGGASARAQSIIRTQSCQELSDARLADMVARGITQYRFVSLEAENTCVECADLDGNTYNIEDATEGINYPPMHMNCQCTIDEVPPEDIDDLEIDDSDLE